MMQDKCLTCGVRGHRSADCKQPSPTASFTCQNCCAKVQINDRGRGSTVLTRFTKDCFEKGGSKRKSDDDLQAPTDRDVPKGKKQRITSSSSVPSAPKPSPRSFPRVTVCGREYAMLGWYLNSSDAAPSARKKAAKSCGRGSLEMRFGDSKTLLAQSVAAKKPTECVDLLPQYVNPPATWTETVCSAVRNGDKLQLRRRASVDSCRNVLFLAEDLQSTFSA